MTVAVQTPTISYNENGSTTSFAVPFRYDNPTDLRAVRRAADGTETELVYGTDYTASTGATDAGGTLTVAVAAASGNRLTILRQTSRSQAADYIASGAFTAESHERALDKAMLVAQEQDQELLRSLKVPPGSTAPQLRSFSGAVAGDIMEVTGPNEFGPVPYANSRTAQAVAEAEAFAQIAGAFTGPLYTTISEGIAATESGAEFPVDNFDGTATMYLNNAGTAVERRPVILDPSNGGTANFLGTKRGGAGAATRTMAAVSQERAISVKDYGAQGDNATDDTTAIQNAIAAIKAEGGGRLILPQGIYRHTGISAEDLRFVTIEGVARGSFGSAGNAGVRLVCTSNTADHIDLTNPHGVLIRQVQLETLAALTPVAGNVIAFNGTNGGAASCRIEDIRIEKHFNGVLIDGVSNSEFVNSQVRAGLGNYCTRLIGSAKRLDQIRLKGIITDSDIGAGSLTQDGFQIDTDVHTVFIEDCSALKARYGFNLSGAIAPEFIYFIAAEAENCNSHGFLIDRSDHVRMMEVYATDNTGNGIVFGATFDSTARIFAPCARGNDGAGILIEGSDGIEIMAPRIGGNSAAIAGTNHGIEVAAGVSNWAVLGGKVGGDVSLTGTGGQGSGILVNSGASNNYRILGVDLQGNQTAGLTDSGTGTNKRIRDNLGAADYGYSRGSATVLAGATTGVFAHGLGTTPSRVLLTPRGNPGVPFWATANGTQAIANLASAQPGNVAFDVEAIL